MNADAFPSDTTQWSDQDGDGYGDNPTGQQPDQFLRIQRNTSTRMAMDWGITNQELKLTHT